MYQTIESFGRLHVLVQSRRIAEIDDPNYKGTGMALCGLVPEGKTLNDWEFEKEIRAIEKINLTESRKRKKRKLKSPD